MRLPASDCPPVSVLTFGPDLPATSRKHFSHGKWLEMAVLYKGLWTKALHLAVFLVLALSWP
jgi:hypothetical protein